MRIYALLVVLPVVAGCSPSVIEFVCEDAVDVGYPNRSLIVDYQNESLAHCTLFSRGACKDLNLTNKAGPILFFSGDELRINLNIETGELEEMESTRKLPRKFQCEQSASSRSSRR
jgi:hypothetical protein